MEDFNKYYWEQRWANAETGWDIGYPSPPITEYFNQVQNKHARILIPGAGNAYEAEYLWQQGFQEVYVLDWSRQALDNLKERLPDLPADHLIESDFFAFEGGFDYVVEQTFFCSLPPALRPQYAAHMHQLLQPGGKLVGVLFDDELYKEHPPFGGTREEYRQYFEPWFDLVTYETCYNSIKPRQGREIFIILRKKENYA